MGILFMTFRKLLWVRPVVRGRKRILPPDGDSTPGYRRERASRRVPRAAPQRTHLDTALDIDHAIESAGSPDKKRFMDLAREQGLKAALAWRDARFKLD